MKVDDPNQGGTGGLSTEFLT